LKVYRSEPGHKLDFLGHTMKMRQPVRKPTREDDWLTWPSWAPNWGHPDEFYPLPKKLYVPVGRGVPWIERVNGRHFDKINVYNASGGSRVEAFINGDRLVAQGVRCDIIQDIITFHGPEATTEANQVKWEIWAAAANRK
jgi:hypothetical protein